MSERYIEAFGYWRTIADWTRVSELPRRTLESRMRFDLPMEVIVLLPSHAIIDPFAAPGAHGSWTWYLLPYEDDDTARAFVRRHPSGGTLDEVGSVMGMCRERVRQVEEQALRKLRAAGLADLDELRAALTEAA